jgi:hypothetical protein
VAAGKGRAAGMGGVREHHDLVWGWAGR